MIFYEMFVQDFCPFFCLSSCWFVGILYILWIWDLYIWYISYISYNYVYITILYRAELTWSLLLVKFSGEKFRTIVFKITHHQPFHHIKKGTSLVPSLSAFCSFADGLCWTWYIPVVIYVPLVWINCFILWIHLALLLSVYFSINSLPVMNPDHHI